MSKKGTYNTAFFNSFAVRIRGTEIRFGILVGTCPEDGQRDALFAAATPPQPQADGGEAAAPPKDVAALLKSSSGGAPFADWAVEHATQLRRLLPGGLEPCGCFAVVTEAAAKDLATLLTPVLKGIPDALVLTVDPASSKLTFWKHEGGAKPALRPAQVKGDSHKDALLLWTATPLDIVVPRGSSATNIDAIVGRVQSGVTAALQKSTAALAPAAEGAPLRIVDFGSEQTVLAATPKDSREVRVDFLSNGTALAVVPGVDGSDSGSCIRLRCLVVAMAVVLRRGAELRQAVGPLRDGVAASAGERLRLALEEAEEDDDEGARAARPSRLQLPWRAFGRPDGCDELPFWCGDYCMPDEDASAGLERLGELLGLPAAALAAAPPHLDERARLGRDFGGTYSPEPAAGPSKDGGSKASGSSFLPAAACALAVACVALAVAIPMLLK